MATFDNYDPKQVIVAFRGIELLGYAEGTFVVAERLEDAFSMEVGSQGDITRVRSRNRTGSITVTLMAGSAVNDSLSAIATSDELTGLGYGSAIVKDLNGNTLVTAAQAWIRKVPNVEYAGDSRGSREWVFDCAELVVNVGGAVV